MSVSLRSPLAGAVPISELHYIFQMRNRHWFTTACSYYKCIKYIQNSVLGQNQVCVVIDESIYSMLSFKLYIWHEHYKLFSDWHFHNKFYIWVRGLRQLCCTSPCWLLLYRDVTNWKQCLKKNRVPLLTLHTALSFSCFILVTTQNTKNRDVSRVCFFNFTLQLEM